MFSLAPSKSSGKGEALLAVMQKFKWTKIAVIQDNLSTTAVGIRPRITMQCEAVLELIKTRSVQHIVIPVDSGINKNFTLALIQAASYSKGDI